MTRPQIIVTVEAALQRRGAPTDTGVAFMVYAGATGATNPTEVFSQAEATASGAPDTVAAFVGDALKQGAPKVILLRAAAVDTAAVLEAEWTTALDKLTGAFGPGQVLIPGVATDAAYDALLAHAAANPARCVLLDTEKDATKDEIVTIATGLADAEGAERACLLAGWSKLRGPAGVPREVPASVITAGLIGRNDAFVGHANNAPAGDQGRGAGFVDGALGLVTEYTDAEHDAMHDAGVSVFRTMLGQPQLYGWVSITSDPRFRQFNWGRISMQLFTGIAAGAQQFLFKQIDGEGRLFSELEGMLRGYLTPLWRAAALFGATANDAFAVDVHGPNTPTTIQAGELHAAVEVSLSPHTEKVVIDVVTNIAEGVAA